MFDLSLKKFYLILLINYCLFGQFALALRCYQCKYGANSLCSSSDLVTVSCPETIIQPTGTAASSVLSCGYAQVIVTTKSKDDYTSVQNYKPLTWRGCVNAASSSTAPASALNYYFLGNTDSTAGNLGIKDASYSYCTTVTDLCNKPRQCYRCSFGWATACNSADTVLDECYDLNQLYCSSLIVTSSTYSCSSGSCYWKGCLAASDVTAMTASNGLTLDNLKLAIGTTNGGKIGVTTADVTANIATIVSTSLNYCSKDGCNGATQLYTMFNLSVMITALLFGLIFSKNI